MIHVDVFARGRMAFTCPTSARRVSVGRGPDNDVRLEGLGVSAQHCLIERTPEGGWLVEDMSGGWTQLDGTIVRGRRPAPDGARVGVGVFELTYRWVEPAPAEAAPADAVAPAADAEATPLVIGDHEVLRELGAGGMGVVLAARDRRTGREVAIKLLKAGREADARARARFEREARVLARLDHPSVVRVLEVGEHEGAPFLVMELVDGESLEARVVRAGALPLVEALELAEGLARALAHAHALGVLHRDVKPGNVLLRADGAALLTDFGLAKDLASASPGTGLTAPACGLGTLGFMAPEQFESARDVSPAADIFGLGATLYTAAVGIPPFARAAPTMQGVVLAVLQGRWPRPSTVRPELPTDLDAVLERCLAVQPAARYESARALAEDLARLRRGEPPLAREAQRSGAVDALDALMDLDLDGSAPPPSTPAAAPAAPVHGPAPEERRPARDGSSEAGGRDLEALVERARARARFAADDAAAAIGLLDEALARAPGRADLWTMRAVARRRAGDERGALADHGEALRRDPQDVGARVGRGLIRLRQRDYAGAARDLERALRQLPAGSRRALNVQRALDRARASLGDTVVRGVRLDRPSGEGPVG